MSADLIPTAPVAPEQQGPPPREPGAGAILGSGYKRLEQFTESELVQKVGNWFRKGLDERRHVERRTLESIAFLMDQHYVAFVNHAGQTSLIELPDKAGRARTIEQIIEPIYRQELSRLTKNRPQGETVPIGLDPEDYDAARAANAVISHTHMSYGLDLITRNAVEWQASAGTSLVGVNWDPDGIDPDGVKGRYRFRALGPFDFTVGNSRQPLIYEQPYIIIAQEYLLDDIEGTWGVRVTQETNGTWGSQDNRLRSILNGGHSGGSGTYDEPTAVVKEVWIKPSPMAPMGAVVLVAGDKLLDMQVFPDYCRGNYPFAVMRFIPIAGSFWGKSMIQSLVPLQRRHNRAASTAVEELALRSQLAMSAPQGTEVRQLMGGKGVMFTPPPHAMNGVQGLQPPQLGDLPWRELEHTSAAASQIASQTMMTGENYKRLESGGGLNVLKELDDSPSAIPIQDIEMAHQRLGQLVIDIASKRWDEQRAIPILGKDGELERKALFGKDQIRGNYIVQRGSAWPYTKGEEEQRVLGMVEGGLIMPEEALDQLEGGNVRQVRVERKLDQRHARLENVDFEALEFMGVGPDGMPQFDPPMPIPEDWHDHPTHLEEHVKLMKTPRFKQWHPMQKMALQAHIAAHDAANRAAILQQMHMQAMMGTGGVPQLAASAAAPVYDEGVADGQAEAQNQGGDGQ